MTDLTLEIPEDVIFQFVDEEAVLLHLPSGTYFSLNSVGARAWQLIEQHGSLAKVVEALRSEYDVAEPQLEQDVERLIGELAGRGLIRRAAS